MIQTLTVTNSSGSSLVLNLGSSAEEVGLLIFNFEGLGPPKATVSGKGGPNFDGIKVSGIRADARHLILTLAVTPRGGTAEEVAKQKIYDHFPIKQEISMRFQTDAKDVYLTGIVESNEANEFAKIENFVISIYCSEPYYENLLEVEEYFFQGVPTTINYDGEIPIGVLIWIVFGQASVGADVVITNTNGDQTMTIDSALFPGSANPEGDKLVIDTRYGQKSVIYYEEEPDSEPELWGTNIINAVDPTGDWIQLFPGENIIEVNGGSTGVPTYAPDDALVEYWPLYENEGEDAVGLHDGKTLLEANTVGRGNGLGWFDASPYPEIIGFETYRYARLFPGAQYNYFRNAAADADLCPTGDFAISMWIKPTEASMGTQDSGQDDILISVDEVSAGGYEIRINVKSGQTYVLFGIKSGGSYVWNTVVLATNIINVWTHLIFWYDVSATTSYIGSGIAATGASQAGVTAPGSYSSKFSLGGKQVVGQYWFTGQMASLQFFNRIIDANERAFVYNNGSGGALYGRTYAEMIGDNNHWLFHRPKFEGI